MIFQRFPTENSHFSWSKYDFFEIS